MLWLFLILRSSPRNGWKSKTTNITIFILETGYKQIFPVWDYTKLREKKCHWQLVLFLLFLKLIRYKKYKVVQYTRCLNQFNIENLGTKTAATIHLGVCSGCSICDFADKESSWKCKGPRELNATVQLNLGVAVVSC